MSTAELADTVQSMMRAGEGLLAMDESNPPCNKRFAKLGIPQTVEGRRDWPEVDPDHTWVGEFISGPILYDETIRQSKSDGTSSLELLTRAGIVPGIKVDTGAKDLAGRKALGLEMQVRDGLREIAYAQWEGKTPEEVSRRFHDEYASWLADPGWNAPTGGERGDIARRSPGRNRPRSPGGACFSGNPTRARRGTGLPAPAAGHLKAKETNREWP